MCSWFSASGSILESTVAEASMTRVSLQRYLTKDDKSMEIQFQSDTDVYTDTMYTPAHIPTLCIQPSLRS